MSKIWSYFLCLIWLAFLMSAGLLLFTSGFFLERVSRTDRSQCLSCNGGNSCNTDLSSSSPQSSANLCLEPRARIVLLIVDALKFEFVSWYDSNASLTFHRNKLPIIHDLIQQNPSHTRLYKFLADPPTTTMQRLKSLATGTLPTFIEVGSNFAAENIEEDNWVDQNSNSGVVFMGDDTWTTLFPNKFLRQYPAPSFNVWDLDTVDREVRKRIFNEMKEDDWMLLIAHILGVDHCGHKHGIHHPEMTRKLNETNLLIKDIVDALEDDMMLIIVGDHGMTESGDHGGESADEVEAAMFVYSKLPLIPSSFVEATDFVNQVDLAPTISAILGTAVPFSNIGTVILDALPSSNNTAADVHFILSSMWKNIIQTKHYIDTYISSATLFSEDNIDKLNSYYNVLLNRINKVDTESGFREFLAEARVYFRELRTMCIEVWVQFNSGLMCKGLVLMFCSSFFFYMIFNGISEARLIEIFESTFLKCSIWSNLIAVIVTLILHWSNLIDGLKDTVLFVTGMVSVCLLAILLVQNWDVISTTWYNASRHKKTNYISRIAFLLTICGLFSNSYIIEEDKILSFLLITFFCLFMYNIDKSDKPNEPHPERKKPFPKPITKTNFRIVLVTVGIFACTAVRFSNYFWRCREEQQRESCSDFIMGKSGSIVSKNFERSSLIVSLVVLALFISITRMWLRNCGNLSGFAPSVMIARYCPAVIVVFMGCYWILKLPKDIKVRYVLSWQVNALPRIVYALVIFSLMVLYYRPLSVYLLPKKRETIDVYHGENIVPRLFKKIKNAIYKRRVEEGEDEELPVVYGLGTVYSSAFILLGVFLVLLQALLLGYVLAPSSFIMFSTAVAVLIMSTIERFQKANNLGKTIGNNFKIY